MKVRFKEWDCNAVPCYYENGRTAIMLLDVEDNGPVAKATVNVPEVELKDDQIIIKDYSENEGMTEALIAGGIVQPEEDDMVPVGYCVCPVHTLTPEFMAVLNKAREEDRAAREQE